MNKAIKVKYHKNGKKFLYLVWLTVGVSKVQCNDWERRRLQPYGVQTMQVRLLLGVSYSLGTSWLIVVSQLFCLEIILSITLRLALSSKCLCNFLHLWHCIYIFFFSLPFSWPISADHIVSFSAFTLLFVYVAVKFVPKMTYYVLDRTLNPTRSFIQCVVLLQLVNMHGDCHVAMLWGSLV